MPDQELLQYARRVRSITRDAGVMLIMNDRPDIAVLSDADGVHVGQDELRVHDVRRIVGPDCLIGVSTHSIEQARDAVLDGASYIGVGPVFNSGTKTFDQLAGLDFVPKSRCGNSTPMVSDRGNRCFESRRPLSKPAGRAVAISGALCRSQNPRHAAGQLVARLSND